MMVRNNIQAVEHAKSIHNGSAYAGLCLKFVRDCYGIGPKYMSAAVAWNGSKHKHKTRFTSKIPVGAPVFFKVPGNKYGHVAIYLGGGMFRTNYSYRKTIVTASLSHPVFNTMTMLGYTTDLNGVKIKFVGNSTPTSAKKYYMIGPGDNLSRIAKAFGTTVPKLLALNPRIINADKIYAGHKIRVK